ncbi:MAG: C4-type zinc ribbon domain-containing protein [Acidobacteriota bacterium]|nr:C4-type zinc ribbon domain-containing protein [Acidobacteriota bacterium]
MSKELRDLVLLVQLQDIYTSISEAIAERNAPPSEIRELQEENRLRQEELEEMERQMAAHEEEIKEVQKKQTEWELELEHFQKQKSIVSNEREFTAVISEIDFATKAIEEAASRRKELEETIEGIQAEVAERRDARPEEEGAQKEVVEAWESRKLELLKIVHDLSTKAKKVEKDIQPKQRARFMRLLESKQGKALSAVVDGSCSLCHFALRPHLQQRVRRSDEIIDCEHCHRILYVEEVLTAWSADPTVG